MRGTSIAIVLLTGIVLHWTVAIRVYAQKSRKSDTEKCGVVNVMATLSSSKETANTDEYPWIGKVYFKGETDKIYPKCLATLISQRHLIVPAHCITGRTNTPREPHLITLGDINAQLHEIEEIALHPNLTYGHSGTHTSRLVVDNDIAVVALTRNVDLAADVQPICLPTATEIGWNYTGLNLHYAGYPRSDATNRKVKVLVTTQSDNGSYMSVWSGLPDASDKFVSGAPVMGIRSDFADADEGRSRFYLVGINAGVGGDNFELVCKVAPRLQWIKDNMV